MNSEFVIMNPMHLKRSLGVLFISLFAALIVAACSSGMSADPMSNSSTAGTSNSTSLASATNSMSDPIETDVVAPTDYGPGPGLTIKAMEHEASVASRAIPVGGSTANLTGVFGPAVTWPIIPIHAVLLPDGRIMSYGTNRQGQQGAQLVYDVWNPVLGTGTNSHMVLPNNTPTDIFCSAQSVMTSGEVLLSGGDLTVNSVRNYSRNDTTVFSPTANTLTENTPMSYARWYGSLVSLPDKRLAIFGGRQNTTQLKTNEAVITPEIYDPASKAWTTLTGATSVAAFGAQYYDWYYPRSYVAPGGNVFVLTNNGPMFSVSTAGGGSIKKYPTNAPPGVFDLPTVPFAPGKVLSIRANQVAVVISYGTSAVVTPTDPIDQERYWASGTVMADGEVLITGGSTVIYQMTGAAYTAQIWDPTTGHWRSGATATKPRLYHSISLLLPDATVLTGGGGAPGQVNNRNSEIFYPPYLYASNGSAAVRPVLTAAGPLAVNVGDTINVNVGPTNIIQRLTFVRTGSATHSTNSDQRFIELPFAQAGQNVSAALPSDPTVLVPGYYMLFAFNEAGVPSIALIFSVA